MKAFNKAKKQGSTSIEIRIGTSHMYFDPNYEPDYSDWSSLSLTVPADPKPVATKSIPTAAEIADEVEAVLKAVQHLIIWLA